MVLTRRLDFETENQEPASRMKNEKQKERKTFQRNFLPTGEMENQHWNCAKGSAATG